MFFLLLAAAHTTDHSPLQHINESDILLHHAPSPPSYWSIDIDALDPSLHPRPLLIAFHAIFFSLAFFLALPIAIALRSVNHPWHPFLVLSFYALSALGCTFGAIYTKSYPNMYEGSSHASHGTILLLLAVLLSLLDFVPLIRRLYAYVSRRDKSQSVLKSFWGNVVLGHERGPEYIGLITHDSDHIDHITAKDFSRDLHDTDTLQWANEVDTHRHHHYSNSVASDGTLFGSSTRSSVDGIPHDLTHQHKIPTPRTPLVTRISHAVFATLERSLVFTGFAVGLSGIVIYTGGCRENYINGCMAHLIKGSIFWCYGLLTFARFLGAFADLGWAWNRPPSPGYPTAEFVESFVIFTYGATNTWMERFGANPGDPFTTKQIQHISIAVMFCFAGLVGMGIESKYIRRWLALPSVLALKTAGFSQSVPEPHSYSASFNPFPALVIGVTGAAMAAHAQRYLFQVQIHALWGNLLLAFSVLRCLTYFFLWLGPPRSILPSRPPTEALASFFLACGGLVFIFSTEEVTFAAMRRGRDDVMMFLNVAVAVTCFAFCWTMFVVALKGWLATRARPGITYQNLRSMTQA